MQVNYTVFSAEKHPVEVDATFSGQVIKATVDGLAVQLVPSDVSHGTVKLVFAGEQMAAAEALFVAGAAIRATFEGA